jgi:hypothetical protein
VAIVDENSIPIVEFAGVPIVGDAGYCENEGFEADFIANPGADFSSSK